jgi:hypothetical protein
VSLLPRARRRSAPAPVAPPAPELASMLVPGPNRLVDGG